MGTLNTANLLIGTVNYWHWWTLAHLSSHGRVKEGHRTVPPGTCPSALKGITSPSPAYCLLQVDIYWCTIIRVIFLTKGFDESLIEWFQIQFHSKLRVTVKTEPMENIYYHLFVTFCNLYFCYFCSLALGKQLCRSGVIPPTLSFPPRACICLTLLGKVTNRVFTFTRPLIDNT